MEMDDASIIFVLGVVIDAVGKSFMLPWWDLFPAEERACWLIQIP